MASPRRRSASPFQSFGERVEDYLPAGEHSAYSSRPASVASRRGGIPPATPPRPPSAAFATPLSSRRALTADAAGAAGDCAPFVASLREQSPPKQRGWLTAELAVALGAPAAPIIHPQRLPAPLHSGPYAAPPTWSAFEAVMYRQPWSNPYHEASPAGRLAAAKRAAAVAVRDRRLRAEAAVDAAVERGAAQARRAQPEQRWAVVASRARGIAAAAGGSSGGSGERRTSRVPGTPAGSAFAEQELRWTDPHAQRLRDLTEQLARRRAAVANEQERLAAGWLALEDECARVERARAALQAAALRDNDAELWAEDADDAQHEA